MFYSLVDYMYVRYTLVFLVYCSVEIRNVSRYCFYSKHVFAYCLILRTFLCILSDIEDTSLYIV